jgi:Transposase DDE domain
VISTVDPDARHGRKTSARGFDGYKGHLAINPDSEIITRWAYWPATCLNQSRRAAMTRTRMGAAAPAPTRWALGQRPLRYRPGHQHRDLSWARECADPPSQRWWWGAAFGTACAHCPLAAQCTTSAAGRTVTVSTYELQLARARAAQADPAWRADYTATRPKVERKIGHLMRTPPRRAPRPRTRQHQGRRRLLSTGHRTQPGPPRRARTAPDSRAGMAGNAGMTAKTLPDNTFHKITDQPNRLEASTTPNRSSRRYHPPQQAQPLRCYCLPHKARSTPPAQRLWGLTKKRPQQRLPCIAGDILAVS